MSVKYYNGYLAFVLVAFFLWATSAWAVQDCEVNGQPVNPNNGSTTQDKSGFMRCRDRDSGQLLREQELKGGHFIGLVRQYKNGLLESEVTINDQGNRDGRYREYISGTQLIRDENYRNGTSIGISRSWHQNGVYKRISFRDNSGREQSVVEYSKLGKLKDLRCADRPLLGDYANDAVLCGHSNSGPVETLLYADNGSPHSRVTYRAGQRVKSELLWENAQVKEQEECLEDVIIQRSFSRTGTRLKEIKWIKEGNGRIKDHEREYHESGVLLRERSWVNGTLASDNAYYMNGNKKYTHRYMKQGTAISCDASEFRDTGTLARQGIYQVRYTACDQPVGVHRLYSIEGTVTKERHYDDKSRLFREVAFYNDGSVERDEIVFEDGSRKSSDTPLQ